MTYKYTRRRLEPYERRARQRADRQTRTGRDPVRYIQQLLGGDWNPTIHFTPKQVEIVRSVYGEANREGES